MFNRVLTSAQTTFFAVSSLAAVCIGSAIAINATIPALEAATAKQCASHDWPVESHDIHIEWCVDNGYEV